MAPERVSTGARLGGEGGRDWNEAIAEGKIKKGLETPQAPPVAQVYLVVDSVENEFAVVELGRGIELPRRIPLLESGCPRGHPVRKECHAFREACVRPIFQRDLHGLQGTTLRPRVV